MKDNLNSKILIVVIKDAFSTLYKKWTLLRKYGYVK